MKSRRCFIYWVGLVGRVDGPEKCPLNFFILCGYLEHVYIYLYTKWKLSPTFLWVSKFDVKLGVWVKNFKIRAGRRLFLFLGLKVHFLFSLVGGRPFFAKSWKKKNLFSFWFSLHSAVIVLKITLYTCFFEKVWWVWVLVWGFDFQVVETYSRSSLSTNPPKGLCKADTEVGLIGGEAAGRAKRG